MSAPVAVVTGASRGIGRHIADALQAHGYAVARGSSIVAAVTDQEAVERWVADVLSRHPRVDLLVNNAGVIDAEVPLLDSEPEQWWRTVEVNVRGAYLVTWVLGRMLRERTGSTDGLRVVNLNSGAGLRPGALATAYNLSKTALARLTGSTHLSGIPCLDLMPGVVRTDMTESMQAHVDRTEWTDPADVTALVLAFAAGDLDAWSGRFVRAGVDTPESLRARAKAGLDESDRTVTLRTWGAGDPLG
ncbi:SDR family NAD(P)-dependent oxidoreductase [Nostocoides sp. F2B08]|uniref:SDR family oxidoreductase n=1 Tax=Nostocoides sp. F2B08 TaxID=2653936 RepID=UPI001262D307|nr:SDR family oxidoreductase [Tetrasphaera sp. F2B08]KAB7744644.1 SDR family NAD(P)-dependent oxidoreductase [Tetrasphaera sp. F2B08]